MKLYSTSYKDKKQAREINELVGESYSFLDRIRMGGIGSKRLEIESATEHFNEVLNASHYQTLVSLEIRPKGVLVYFRRRLDNFTAVYPFEELEISNAKTICFKSGDSSICFKDGYVIDSSFFDKMIKDMEDRG